MTLLAQALALPNWQSLRAQVERTLAQSAHPGPLSSTEERAVRMVLSHGGTPDSAAAEIASRRGFRKPR